MHNNIIFHALLNIGAALRAHFSRLDPAGSQSSNYVDSCSAAHTSARKSAVRRETVRATPDYTGG
ncbi:hypothetical protein [Paraburkholderia atlantica]|uniref:hypothetical protein n=1 Tax=Paraburkholderia atlantica TaxID=2654982 RepID=UPI003D1A2702